MSEIQIHQKLDHLSLVELDDLIELYYAKKPITDLISQFNIHCSPNQLYKLLPPEISPVSCPSCGGLMISGRRSRSTNRSSHIPSFHCQDCKHQEKDTCRCVYCRDIKQQRIDKSERHTIKANDLTLEQAVTLLSILNCFGNRKIKCHLHISHTKAFKTPFAPVVDYGDGLIMCLIDAGLLRHNTLPSTSLNFNSHNSKILATNLSQFSLSNAITPKLLDELESIISRCDWPMHWFEDVVDLAMNLSVAECKEFYDFCATERDFPIIEDRFIESMILNILLDFSPGQCMRIILSGAQYASDYLVKSSATPKMVANYMLNACQRFADKARKENWELQSLRRNVNCPRSMISIILHDYILQSDAQGLNTPVSLLQLPQKT